MRFSVIIINYNYSAYLGTAIESVLSQTLPAAEIIVVDDGSTDDSVAKAKAFGSRVSVVTQSNLGHVAAFEAGFAVSHGDIIIFLDADDFLYPNCLAEIQKCWTYPKIVKVQYLLDTVNQDGVDQNMPFPFLSSQTTPDKIKNQAWSTGIYPWTVSSGNAYDRHYIEDILPIDENRFPRSPDGYANKLAPLFGDVVSLPQTLGAYRVHGENAWAQGHGALDVSVITRTLELDLELDREFLSRGNILGLPLTPRDDLETPQHLEYRFLSMRLSPNNYPILGEHRVSLLCKALRSTSQNNSLSLRAQLLWFGWFILLAMAPTCQVERLYRRMRGQTKRSALAKSLIGLTR